MARRVLEVALVGDERSLNKAFKSANRNAAVFGSKMSRSGAIARKAMGATVLAVGGVGAAFAGALKAASGFEKQMSSLEAVTGANARQMKAFRKQALDAGKATAYSAREAAQAQTELAKGGLSVAQIMKGGLKSALSLAAAGELELGEAAGVTVNAMKLFNIHGGQSMKVADGLATAANTTTADVSDFGMALKQAGSVAKMAGYDFTETMVGLEALAQAGIKNSDAGTSMKAAMLQLLGPSEKQLGLQEELGVSFINANGRMKSQAAISEMLRGKLGGMGEAQRTATLKVLAGADGVRYLSSVYAAGPKELKKYEKGLKEQGTAAKVAETKQDNLAGSFERLKGTMETIAIKATSKVIPALRGIVDFIDDVASRIAEGESPLPLIGEQISKGLDAIDWKKLGQKIRDGLKGAFQGGADLVSGVDWKSVGDKISTGLSVAFTASGKLPGAISAGIGLALSKVDTGALASKMAEVAIKMLATLADPAFWVANWREILSVVTLVIPIGKLLKIPGFSTLYKWVSKPVLKAITAFGKAALKLFGKVGSGAVTGFLVGLEKVFPRVAGVLLKLVTISGKQIGRLPGKLRGLAARAGAAVAGALANAAGSVGEAAGRITGRAVKALGKGIGRFAAIGARFVSNVAKGVASRIGVVITGMLELGRKAFNQLKDLPARFFTIGKQIVQGLVDGIVSMGGKAADAAGDLAKGVVDKAKSLLDIFSPSKRFQWIGKMVGEGLKLGLYGSAAGVKDATAKGLLYPLDAAIAALEAKKEKLQAAWDKIDAVAEKSKMMADLRRAKNAPIKFSGGGFGGSGGSGGGSGLSWAREMVGGFAESTGQNMGPELDRLQKEFGHHAAAWCAMFATKAIVKAGGSKDLLTAAVQDVRNWATAGTHGLQKGVKKTPRAGDLMMFGNDHIGVVEKIVNGIVHTIEGNTSSGKVARRTHAVGAGDYARPVFGGRGAPAMSSGGGGKKKSKLTPQEIRGLAYAAGFRGKALDTAVAIAMAESGGKVKATNKNSNGSIDRGLFQINSIHGKGSTTNIGRNVKTAFDLFKKAGNSFKDWVTFNTGAFRQHLGNVGTGKGSMPSGVTSNAGERAGNIREARKALTEFMRDAKRANKLAKIDIKVRKLEKLKAFKDAIKEIRDQVADLGSQAASVWRERQEKAFDVVRTLAHASVANSAQAKELAALEADDARIADEKELAGLNAAIEDAKYVISRSGGKEREEAISQLKDAEDALAAYKRGKRADELREWVENENQKADDAYDSQVAGLDEQEFAYRDSLAVQLGDLATNLEQRKIAYATWAKATNAILKAYGLSVETSADQQAAIPNPGSAPTPVASKPQPRGNRGRAIGTMLGSMSGLGKRALGGPVAAGVPYEVGEHGREMFVPDRDGRIIPNHRLPGRGGVYVDMRGSKIVSDRSARIMANRLAFRIATQGL